MFSSSGYHSDYIAHVDLEASEVGCSCCWVTEIQGELNTSLRTVGHSGGVEAVGSWSWTSPLPCYPDTWGTGELSSDTSRSGRNWSGRVVQTTVNSMIKHVHCSYLSLVERTFWRHFVEQFDHVWQQPRWCTLCCTGGWARWHWLLLYCSPCTLSESLPQVGSQF